MTGCAGSAEGQLPDAPGENQAAAAKPVSGEPKAATGQKDLTLDLGQGVTMKLVLIPAGTFRMGSLAAEKGRDDDEGPQRRVTLTRPFFMGVYEVTQEQYSAVMGSNPSHFKGAKNPVERVSWSGAMEFCRRVSVKTGRTVRLPTEAEWEYACRAGTTTPFHTGQTISTDQANYDGPGKLQGNVTHGNAKKGEYREKTIAVGSFKPNGWGLYDMHGNVWEWCNHWYVSSYAGADTRDPRGPSSGIGRVVRGGGWCYDARRCRSAYRNKCPPGRRYDALGFRVVVD